MKTFSFTNTFSWRSFNFSNFNFDCGSRELPYNVAFGLSCCSPGSVVWSCIGVLHVCHYKVDYCGLRNKPVAVKNDYRPHWKVMFSEASAILFTGWVWCHFLSGGRPTPSFLDGDPFPTSERNVGPDRKWDHASPPPAASCHCSGRYASHWNEFLFNLRQKFLKLPFWKRSLLMSVKQYIFSNC